MSNSKKQGYRVLNGINYPPGKRAETGDVVYDILPPNVRAFLQMGVIEPVVEDGAPSAAAPEANKEGGE